MRPVTAACRTGARFCVRTRPDKLRVESQHFLDIRRVRIKRLAQRLAGQNVRLVERAEVMYYALAHPPVGIAQANNRPRADLSARNTARIGGSVFLSHVGLLISAALSASP